MTFKLRGPLEKDVQAWILASLGVEQFELRQSKNKRALQKFSLNVWLSPGQIWWRANSGMIKAPSGAMLRMGCPGMADIMGSVQGRPVALEVKREGEHQNPAQRRWQAWAEAAGYVYAVVRSPGEARAVVERVAEGRLCDEWSEVLG